MYNNYILNWYLNNKAAQITQKICMFTELNLNKGYLPTAYIKAYQIVVNDYKNLIK